mmetsp:Transcript_38346/g.44670  ORF Transcript_38346/g.44670 Transcript_38346/m.44670 type:complete len:336 (+) Transcript_38346:43-1050(+)
MSKTTTASKKASKDTKESKQKVNWEGIIMEGLSNPGLTFDRKGYALRNLDLKAKGLDSLHVTFIKFENISYMDLSENGIQDFSVLKDMPYLITLNMSKCNVRDIKGLAAEEGFRNLQHLNLSDNKIVELSPIKAPKLITINLTDNRIEKGESFDGHPTLMRLELRRNKIGTTAFLGNMPSLRELHLAENKIKTITGLDGLANLKILNLRKNLIDGFEEGPAPNESIEYLNLRENKISKFEEIVKLQAYAGLKTLIFSYNPITTTMEHTYFFETLTAFPKINRINKHSVTKPVRLKWIKYAEDKYLAEKRKQEEEERRQKELEDRELAAQQAADDN